AGSTDAWAGAGPVSGPHTAQSAMAAARPVNRSAFASPSPARTCHGLVRQRLEERDELLFLRWSQSQVANGAAHVGRDLGRRPAVDLLTRVLRTVAAAQDVPRVVEMVDLFQTLQVAVV